MLYLGTVVNVVDNTGILKARCIKVYGSTKKLHANIGDYILVVVLTYTLKRGLIVDDKKKNRFLKGNLHRAIVLRTKNNFMRIYGFFLRFSDNAVILVNKRKLPLSKRIKGPLTYEIVDKYPAIGILSSWVV